MTSTQLEAPAEATPVAGQPASGSRSASAGQIAFGMENGTVSIFGVAVSAPNSHAVLLAGATGAVAAAVSMMAGDVPRRRVRER